MRYQLLKLRKNKSTKSERRFAELLKKNHIKFRAKVKINGREVDFLIGNYAIDIDCHSQDVEKNLMLKSLGYIPIHFTNQGIRDNYKEIELWLQKLVQISLPHKEQQSKSL